LLVPILPRTVLLWILRVGLVAALLGHLHAAVTLTRLNRVARPVKYQSARDYQAANFASRSMRYTGVFVLLFIVWHLLDLTAGTVNGGNFVRGDAYNNVAHSFDRPVVAIVYIVANIALGVHLFHGVWSLFQSMGWSHPRFNAWRRQIAVGIATVIVVGNVSFPIAVLTKIIEVQS
jgi:succinate dehydrogenase / fumarate reductase cytochrome b subunit